MTNNEMTEEEKKTLMRATAIGGATAGLGIVIGTLTVEKIKELKERYKKKEDGTMGKISEMFKNLREKTRIISKEDHSDGVEVCPPAWRIGGIRCRIMQMRKWREKYEKGK